MSWWCVCPPALLDRFSSPKVLRMLSAATPDAWQISACTKAYLGNEWEVQLQAGLTSLTMPVAPCRVVSPKQSACWRSTTRMETQ